MSFYHGQVSSYQELVNVVVENSIAEGWSYQNNILSKNNIFVSLEAANVGSNNRNQPVVRLVAGTGIQDQQLLNKSVNGMAAGKFYPNNEYGLTFPLEYNLHIHEDEVFLVLKYSIDYFQYLAWGKNWIAGTFGVPATGRFLYDGINPLIIIIDQNGGGGNDMYTTGAFFWTTNFTSDNNYYKVPHNACIFNGSTWDYQINSIESQTPLVARNLSNFFGESNLLAINVIKKVASSKSQLVTEIKNARYIRIDHYEPSQIITLGNERWKIYPFYRKNASARDGGWTIDHTGTFGWAIRYDGP